MISLIKQCVAPLVGRNPVGFWSAAKLQFLLLTLTLMMAALGAGPAVTTAQEMVKDPATGKTLTAPEYGGSITLATKKDPEIGKGVPFFFPARDSWYLPTSSEKKIPFFFSHSTGKKKTEKKKRNSAKCDKKLSGERTEKSEKKKGITLIFSISKRSKTNAQLFVCLNVQQSSAHF